MAGYRMRTEHRMQSLATRVIASMTVVAVLSGVNIAQAALFDPLTASLLAESTIPDTDWYLLILSDGFQPGETLLYDSISDMSMWRGTLSGTYLGKDLNITYMGDLRALSTGGPITWTSQGFYGPDVWSGSGRFSIAQGANEFQVIYESVLTVGSASGGISSIINGQGDLGVDFLAAEWLYTGNLSSGSFGGISVSSRYRATAAKRRVSCNYMSEQHDEERNVLILNDGTVIDLPPGTEIVGC